MTLMRWLVLVLAFGVVGYAQPVVDPALFPTADNPIYLKIDALQAAIESMRAYVQQALVNAPRNTPRRVLDPLRDAVALADTTIEQWWRWGRPRATALTNSAPLLTVSNILGTRQGGIRLPSGSTGGDTVSRPFPIAWDAANTVLYVGTYAQNVFTMTVPTPVDTATIASMNRGAYVQAAVDPIEGQNNECDNGDVPGCGLWGLLVRGTRLLGTLSNNYDGSTGTHKQTFYSRPKTLSTTGDAKGLDNYWNGSGSGLSLPGYAGFTSGYIIDIPSEWQASLGGYDVASGNCCQSIIARNSYGPSLGGYNPDLIGGGGTQPHAWQPFVYYPSNNATLGLWDNGTNTPSTIYYGLTQKYMGAVMFNGTRTAAFFGVRGETQCYGVGVAVAEWHRTFRPEVNDIACYDPGDNSHGQHGYPYHYFVALYDINDFAAVVAGTKQPWQVLPYAGEDFTFPVAMPAMAVPNIEGVAWDATNKHLYLVQKNSDDGGERSLIWRYLVNTTP